MKIYRESIPARSTGLYPTFHKITDKVQEIIDRSGIRNGICVVYSHHTTCSVLTQECSFALAYTGLAYVQQDLVDILETLPQGRAVHASRSPADRLCREHR